MGCCLGIEFFSTHSLLPLFFWRGRGWLMRVEDTTGWAGSEGTVSRGLCPSRWQWKRVADWPQVLIYGATLQRPGGVSVSDGDPGLLQNGPCQGIFTMPTLLCQSSKFHCLREQFMAMGLSPCFSSLCFFCLLIKCEVTKQLNSSVVFRQEVEKGYPGGKANMIDRG